MRRSNGGRFKLSARSVRLSIEGFWIILGQAMTVLGALVGVRLLTEVLHPAAYGELALGMTIAILVNQTILGPLGNGVARFYAPAMGQGDLAGYLRAAFQLVRSATWIIALLIVGAVGGLLVLGQAEWIWLVVMALIFATLSGYNSILSSIQNASRHRSVVALHQGADSWLRFLTAAGLLLWVGRTSFVAMAGYAAATLLVLASQFLFFRLKVLQNAVEEKNAFLWRQSILKFSWPFATWGVFSWAQQVSDRWALGIYRTTEEVGLYAVLFQLGYYPLTIVTGMAMQFIAPVLYQRVGDAGNSERNAEVSRVTWGLAAMALGMTFMVFLIAVVLHERIFRIFVADAYLSVSHLLPWMLLAGGVFAAGQTISLDLMARMETRSMIAAKLVTAILGVICHITGARWYGTEGVVAAGVSFSAMYFAWMCVLARKVKANSAAPGVSSIKEATVE